MVLPDMAIPVFVALAIELSQCTYRCVVLPDWNGDFSCAAMMCLNAPTGAWCSLTANKDESEIRARYMSQCTYRCVVLPDHRPEAHRHLRLSLNAPTGAWCSLTRDYSIRSPRQPVSMHLQVRGAP